MGKHDFLLLLLFLNFLNWVTIWNNLSSKWNPCFCFQLYFLSSPFLIDKTRSKILTFVPDILFWFIMFILVTVKTHNDVVIVKSNKRILVMCIFSRGYAYFLLLFFSFCNWYILFLLWLSFSTILLRISSLEMQLWPWQMVQVAIIDTLLRSC